MCCRVIGNSVKQTGGGNVIWIGGRQGCYRRQNTSATRWGYNRDVTEDGIPQLPGGGKAGMLQKMEYLSYQVGEGGDVTEDRIPQVQSQKEVGWNILQGIRSGPDQRRGK